MFFDALTMRLTTTATFLLALQPATALPTDPASCLNVFAECEQRSPLPFAKASQSNIGSFCKSVASNVSVCMADKLYPSLNGTWKARGRILADCLQHTPAQHEGNAARDRLLDTLLLFAATCVYNDMTVFWKSDSCYAYVRKECVEKRSLEKCHNLDKCPPPINNGTVESRSIAMDAIIPDQANTPRNASLRTGLNVFLPFLASLLILTYLD